MVARASRLCVESFFLCAAGAYLDLIYGNKSGCEGATPSRIMCTDGTSVPPSSDSRAALPPSRKATENSVSPAYSSWLLSINFVRALLILFGVSQGRVLSRYFFPTPNGLTRLYRIIETSDTASLSLLIRK
jgi:hypothetical protein